MAGRDATPTATAGVAEIYDIHQIKDFGSEKLVRKKLFKTKQLWSEIACYEPGQATVMHSHPYEEEAIFVLEGKANMSIDGQEVLVPAGAVVRFPAAVQHDVRNLQKERLVIMFSKLPVRLAKYQRRADGLI